MWHNHQSFSATSLPLVVEDEGLFGGGSGDGGGIDGRTGLQRPSSSLELGALGHRLRAGGGSRRATVVGSAGTMNETFQVSPLALGGGGGGGDGNPFARFTAVARQGASLHPLFQRHRPNVSSSGMPLMAVGSGGLHVAAAGTNAIGSGGSLSLASSSSSNEDAKSAVGARKYGLDRPLRAGDQSHAQPQSRTHTARGIAPFPAPLGGSQTGPSVLYRLIAAAGRKDWGAILRRARSHPHEACFYDPNAGGHVYALHRLLRKTGGGEQCRGREDGDCCSSLSSISERSRGRCRGRPPLEVVEAVMQACPRAVTRKQAVADEDAILMGADGVAGLAGKGPNVGASGEGGGNTSSDNMDWQSQVQRQHLLLNFPPPAAENDAPLQVQGPPPDDDNGDEVRFEYPLAIACECDQDCDVVRLLASHLSTTVAVYRSEVFRSLDYASLPNPVVRILLEEYAGCVLERGTNSEATEGDDDDCPLEQVLFWWDDPDMMGMEEGEGLVRLD